MSNNNVTIHLMPSKELLIALKRIGRQRYLTKVLAIGGIAYLVWADSKRRELEKRVDTLATNIEILAEEE